MITQPFNVFHQRLVQETQPVKLSLGQEPKKHNVTDFRENTDFALLSPENAFNKKPTKPYSAV